MIKLASEDHSDATLTHRTPMTAAVLYTYSNDSKVTITG